MNNRRDFFKKIVPIKEEKSLTLFPPYYKNIIDFDNCLECDGICANVCEEEIIKIVDKKPVLDFSKRGCTFCDECAKVCPKDVLKIENKKDIDAIMSIDMIKCLAWNKTLCSFCLDVCDERAIKFLGLLRPEIITDLCTGCGFCVGVCPTDAIKIMGREIDEKS